LNLFKKYHVFIDATKENEVRAGTKTND